MPKLLCRCKYVIDRTRIPNDDDWLMINDVVYDQSFSGMVDSDKVYDAMNRAVKCPNCGRLWVFWERGQPAACYKLEGHEGQLDVED